MLGTREPEIYGSETLGDIEKRCRSHAEKLSLAIDFKQSNHEGEMVDWIQSTNTEHQGIIINAGAYTHTSVAIFDALSMVTIPIIEVHLSNIFTREDFRHHSYISPLAKGVICGFGAQGYLMALEGIHSLLNDG